MLLRKAIWCAIEKKSSPLQAQTLFCGQLTRRSSGSTLGKPAALFCKSDCDRSEQVGAADAADYTEVTERNESIKYTILRSIHFERCTFVGFLST